MPSLDRIELKPGNWLFKIYPDDHDHSIYLPFNAVVFDSNRLEIRNAVETIEVNNIHIEGDSILITMPVFDSEFKGKLEVDIITGFWHNYYKGDDYKISFEAYYGVTDRFETDSEAATDLTGKWEVKFDKNNIMGPTSIATFYQHKNIVAGTFQTETGDYRFLEGIVSGNQLNLSAFDGAHAFLFKATLNEHGILKGSFWSGSHWIEDWYAERNDGVLLPDMKELTYLKPGYDKLAFQFPDEKEVLISLDDNTYSRRVTIVQILGTWCPNCMDETRYLTSLYKKYHKQGLEIIGLDFEPRNSIEYFKKRVKKFKEDLQVPYPIVFAGISTKKEAAKSLPMLNHILSYPTAIFIDKSGVIREIHTGFSGPSTGKDYNRYCKETDLLIATLLKE